MRQTAAHAAGVLEALLALAIADAMLWTVGLDRCLRWLPRLTPARGQHPARESVAAIAADRAVRQACALYFRNVVCLQRALSVKLLCCRRGIVVNLVIGVAKHPFASHAWVESDATVINEDAAFIRTLVPIVRV